MKMKLRTVKELLLYNYRYWFGYSIVIGFIIYFLGWRIGTIPNGLSSTELAVAARNTSLETIFQSPLHLLHSFLQWLSIQLFGVTTWSLRLGSLLIGLVVALALYTLLKKWFGKPTALLSTAIFISADWFLFIARLGTGAIEFSLWLCLALICFTKLLEKKSSWLLLLAIAYIGLLFSPFGIYAVLTLSVGLFTSRVFRERVLEAPWPIKGSVAVLLTAATAIIVYISTKNIAFLQNLFGIQSLPTITGYITNVLGNLSSVVAVLPNGNPTISPTGVFFVRFFEFAFILFGVIMFWRTRVNRLNLIVLLVSVVLVLASGLSSGSRGSGLILIPAAIFMTAGVRHFLHRWQRTFPKNPYARVAAYIPLTILFIGIVSLHYASYFLLWPTQASTHQVFQNDVLLASKELQRDEYQGKHCTIFTKDNATQTLISHSKPICTLSFFTDAKEISPEASTVFLQANTPLKQPVAASSTRVLTSESKEDNVRWVVLTVKPQDAQ